MITFWNKITRDGKISKPNMWCYKDNSRGALYFDYNYAKPVKCDDGVTRFKDIATRITLGIDL
jgi:hypothetical protein